MDPSAATSTEHSSFSEVEGEAMDFDDLWSGRFYYDKMGKKIDVISYIDSLAFGKVYRAKKEEVHIAVKVLETTVPKRRKDALFEAKILEELSPSSWTPQFYGCTELNNCIILEMSLLGSSLWSVNNQNISFFNSHELVNFARELLEAMSFLHEKGFLHGDLKPSNICLKSETSKSIVLADMGGVYKIAVMSRYQPGVSIGTRPYRSPEALFGLPLSEKLDLWAGGITIAETAIGDMVFQAEDLRHLCRDLLAANLVSDAARETDLFAYLAKPAMNMHKYRAPFYNLHYFLMKRIIGGDWTTEKKKKFVELIISMLTPDPSARPSARSLLDSKFTD